MNGSVAGRLTKLEQVRRGPRPVHVMVEPNGLPDPDAWFAEQTRGIPAAALVARVMLRDAGGEMPAEIRL